MGDEYDEAGYQSFVKVVEKEGSDDIMELPIEKNGTVLLSTIQAQFPNAIGLKYKSSTGGWRGIRAVDNILDPPGWRGIRAADNIDEWGETTYCITESSALKRKSTANGHVKSKRSGGLLEDIIVLGLPYTTTEDELKEYFTNSCGDLAYQEVKLDRDTKKSRGFGFIRFTSEDAAKEALNGQHYMQGRKLEVRMSKKKENPMKLFVGRLPSGTTKEDVDEYFGEFGEMVDVFVPSPFRGFSFITYASQEDAMRVLRMNHVMAGARLNVTAAEPKEEKAPGRQENFGVSKSNWNPDGPTNNRNAPPPGRNDRYQENAPVQKDVASELKEMLLSLIRK